MNAYTHMELLVGLLSVIGSASLIAVAANKPPKVLQDAIAAGIERSIAVLEGCKDDSPS